MPKKKPQPAVHSSMTDWEGMPLPKKDAPRDYSSSYPVLDTRTGKSWREHDITKPVQRFDEDLVNRDTYRVTHPNAAARVDNREARQAYPKLLRRRKRT